MKYKKKSSPPTQQESKKQMIPPVSVPMDQTSANLSDEEIIRAQENILSELDSPLLDSEIVLSEIEQAKNTKKELTSSLEKTSKQLTNGELNLLSSMFKNFPFNQDNGDSAKDIFFGIVNNGEEIKFPIRGALTVALTKDGHFKISTTGDAKTIHEILLNLAQIELDIRRDMCGKILK